MYMEEHVGSDKNFSFLLGLFFLREFLPSLVVDQTMSNADWMATDGGWRIIKCGSRNANGKISLFFMFGGPNIS